MKSLALLVASVTLTLACSREDRGSESSLQSEPIAISLGDAYDSLRLRLTNHRCVSFQQEVYDGVSQRSGFIRKIDDVQETARSMGYSLEGSFQYGLARGEAKAKMISEGRTSDRTTGFVAYSRVVSRVDRAMSPRTIDTSRERCGDRFVTSVSYGAEMSVLVKMSFSSREMLERFNGSVGGGYASLGDIKASIDTLDAATKKFGSLTIEHTVSGESLEHVNQIFEGLDVIRCSLDAFDSCERVLARIVEYQNGPLASHAQGSRTVIEADFSPYSGDQQAVDPVIAERREALYKLVEQAEKDDNRSRFLLDSGVLNRSERDQLSDDRGAIEFNLGKIKEAIVACFDAPASCGEPARLRPYSRAGLGDKIVEREVIVTETTRGVTGCEGRIRGQVERRCAAEAAKFGTDIDAVGVDFGRLNSEMNDSIINGRSCKAKMSDSTCHVKLRY